MCKSVAKPVRALLIIDVQNDFISGSLANRYGADVIVPVINGMRDAFDLVVISMDWHPHDHCSFVESANGGKVALAGKSEESYVPFTMVTLRGDADRAEHPQMLYPRHAVCNTQGGACHPALDGASAPHTPQRHIASTRTLDGPPPSALRSASRKRLSSARNPPVHTTWAIPMCSARDRP